MVSQALSAAPPSVDLWTAAATSNFGALEEHLAAGTNLNAANAIGSSALNDVAFLIQPKPPSGCLRMAPSSISAIVTVEHP